MNKFSEDIIELAKKYCTIHGQTDYDQYYFLFGDDQVTGIIGRGDNQLQAAMMFIRALIDEN